MKFTVLTSFVALTVLCLGMSAHAQSYEEEQAANLSEIDTLNKDVEGLGVENDIADSEVFADEESTKASSAEASALKSDVNSLTRQLSSLKSEVERTRKKAEIAAKRLELQEQLKADAKKRVALSNGQKLKQEKIKDALQKRTQAVEGQASLLKRKNAELQSAVKEISKEATSLERRLRIATAQIVRGKSRRKVLMNRKTRMSQLQQRLKSETTRAERKAKSLSES